MFSPRPGSDSDDSADGKPLDGGMSTSILAPAPPAGAFIKSKWETVDPEQVRSRLKKVYNGHLHPWVATRFGIYITKLEEYIKLIQYYEQIDHMY